MQAVALNDEAVWRSSETVAIRFIFTPFLESLSNPDACMVGAHPKLVHAFTYKYLCVETLRAGLALGGW